MNWMRRIRCILLCALLALSLAAVPAFAAGEEKSAGEEALLLAEDTVFTVDGVGYGDLKSALENAPSGSTVVMTAPSYTLVESVVIPSGVTLLLPYADSALTVNDGAASLPYANSAPNGSGVEWTGPGENTLHTLVLGENVTVTVGSGAKLVLGGQYSSSSSGLGGQTCGSHSDMVLSAGSQVLVRDGGVLSAMGYITGSGPVSVTTGGRVYEPFVVTDYHGGTYTAVLYMTKDQTPFNSYAMINIQCPMTMDSASFLYGYCDLYAGDGHNTTTALMVGPADGLLNLAEGTSVSFTYDESRQVASHYGIGKTTLSISGDATLGYMTLTVSDTTVKTNAVPFPVPYNLTAVLERGTLAVNYGVKVLPGGEVIVREGATLEMKKEKPALLVYEGFDPRDYGAPMYPSTQALAAAGLSQRGRLIVDGEMIIGSNATFAGLVETNGNGYIRIYSNATLAASVVEGGCAGDAYFDYALNATTQTSYQLTARVGDYYDPGSYLTLEDGKRYYAANGNVVENAVGYTYTSYSDSGTPESIDAAYHAPETLRGLWATEPVHRHTYGEAVFTWAEDLTSALATVTCSCGQEDQTVCAITSLCENGTVTITAEGAFTGGAGNAVQTLTVTAANGVLVLPEELTAEDVVIIAAAYNGDRQMVDVQILDRDEKIDLSGTAVKVFFLTEKHAPLFAALTVN